MFYMISIMIPTYNEKENITPLVQQLSKLHKSAKIIIVDDDSPDGTGKVADELSKKYNVSVVHRKEKGRGTAGIRGFKEAVKTKADFIIEMDADFSHDPKYIQTFLKEIKNSDIIVGSRMVGEGKVIERNGLRNAITFLGGITTKLILGIKVKDVQSGYKCYRREVLESLDFDKFISKGYSIGAETLYKASEKGFSIKEVPIVFKNRSKGKSKFNTKEMIMFLFNVMRLRLGI